MIRIYPSLWDACLHVQRGGPDHRAAALALIESGYRVVIHPDKKMSDSSIAVSCDTDEEVLAVTWLFPGVDDDGPLQ